MAIQCGELAIVERFIAAGVRPQRRSPAPRMGGSPGGIAPFMGGSYCPSCPAHSRNEAPLPNRERGGA